MRQPEGGVAAPIVSARSSGGRRPAAWAALVCLVSVLSLLSRAGSAIGLHAARSVPSPRHPAQSLSYATVATVAVGANPQWDDLDRVTGTVYVANWGTGAGTHNTVSVIDGRTCRATDVAGCGRRPSSVDVGAAPSALAVDPATDTVYVANGNDTVAVIDGATCNAEVRAGCGQDPPEVTVGDGPSSVTIDPANHTAYVTDAGSNDVSMVDTLSCNASRLSGCSALDPPTVPVGVGPADTAVDELTHTVYVTDDDETGPNDGTTVSVLDASTCNSTTQRGCDRQGLVMVGTGPLAVAVDDSTNTIYTANYRSDSVSVIDGRRCDASDLSGCRASSPARVAAGESPNFVALDVPAHTLYVSDYAGDELSVISTAACNSAHLAGCSRTVPETLRTGSEPNGVAVDAATSTLYVPNGMDDNVSVVDVARCDAANATGCRQPAASVSPPVSPT